MLAWDALSYSNSLPTSEPSFSTWPARTPLCIAEILQLLGDLPRDTLAAVGRITPLWAHLE
jgi:hypothetical protein